MFPLQTGNLPARGDCLLWSVLPKGVKYLFETLARLDSTYKAAYLQVYRACFEQIASARAVSDPFLLFETL